MNKRKTLKALLNITGPELNDLLDVYLDVAANKIITRAFPYDDTVTAVPARYELLQCEIAAYLYNKRGAEGETRHAENGTDRSYENADVPASLMNQIVPAVGVPS
jgi:hypothetical protein